LKKKKLLGGFRCNDIKTSSRGIEKIKVEMDMLDAHTKPNHDFWVMWKRLEYIQIL